MVQKQSPFERRHRKFGFFRSLLLSLCSSRWGNSHAHQRNNKKFSLATHTLLSYVLVFFGCFCYGGWLKCNAHYNMIYTARLIWQIGVLLIWFFSPDFHRCLCGSNFTFMSVALFVGSVWKWKPLSPNGCNYRFRSHTHSLSNCTYMYVKSV